MCYFVLGIIVLVIFHSVCYSMCMVQPGRAVTLAIDAFIIWCISPFSGWQYSTGFVNESMIRDHMPQAGPDTQVLMCGPPPMVQFACITNLERNGFDSNMYFAF